jgi:hypothetical protein
LGRGRQTLVREPAGCDQSGASNCTRLHAMTMASNLHLDGVSKHIAPPHRFDCFLLPTSSKTTPLIGGTIRVCRAPN